MAYCHDEGRFQFVCEHFRLHDLAVASLADSFANSFFLSHSHAPHPVRRGCSCWHPLRLTSAAARKMPGRKREEQRKRKKSRKSHVPFFFLRRAVKCDLNIRSPPAEAKLMKRNFTAEPSRTKNTPSKPGDGWNSKQAAGRRPGEGGDCAMSANSLDVDD